MVAVDTNVLVRLLTGDHPAQVARVMHTMLQMRKLDLDAIVRAAPDTSTSLTGRR